VGFCTSSPQPGIKISTLIFEKKIMEAPYCGLEVQKPTQALKSVKGPSNTFDINSK
jgi:hypothetical protein